MSWDELVALKRKYSDELKDLTTRIIEIDKNKSNSTNQNIREQRGAIDSSSERIKQIRLEIDKLNTDLLSVSEKVSQSKNFLGIIESRLPSEKEEDLFALISSNNQIIDQKKYKSEREKNEILSKVKEAAMKLEAIKAVKTMKEQLSQYNSQASDINSSIRDLNEEMDSLRKTIAEANSSLDNLYGAKRQMGFERQDCLERYDRVIKEFDAINSRLDSMAEMRKKQRQEYGHRLPADALFKVKEEAEKKLKSGSKLTLDELKLVFNEEDR